MPNNRSKINDQNKKNTTTQADTVAKIIQLPGEKKDWPINGLLLTSSILYRATIKSNDSKYKQNKI